MSAAFLEPAKVQSDHETRNERFKRYRGLEGVTRLLIFLPNSTVAKSLPRIFYPNWDFFSLLEFFADFVSI
jgi:hypothetical protein